MILFKAIDGYNENTDLMPLDINSKIPLKKHLLEGTIHKTKSGTFTSKPKTRFQSTTKKIAVAAYKYAPGPIDNPNYRRSKIVLIDLPDNVTRYNFTDPVEFKNITKGWLGVERVKNFVEADREVTVEGMIPKECVREIPPIFVDILALLSGESGQKGFLYDVLIQKIISGEITVQNTLDTMNKISFNNLERRFINSYYEDYKHAAVCGNELFSRFACGNNTPEDYAVALRTQVLKEVFNSNEFIRFVSGEKSEKNFQNYKAMFSNISGSFYGISERKIFASKFDEKENTQKSTSKTEKLHFFDALVLMDSRKTIGDTGKYIVNGMEYIKNNSGLVTGCKMLHTKIFRSSNKEYYEEDPIHHRNLVVSGGTIPVIEPTCIKEFVVPEFNDYRRIVKRIITNRIKDWIMMKPVNRVKSQLANEEQEVR